MKDKKLLHSLNITSIKLEASNIIRIVKKNVLQFSQKSEAGILKKF
jgi:hypothetical protein